LHGRRLTIPKKFSNREANGVARYREPSGGQPMRAFYVEISAKLIYRSDSEPDDLPEDIYSQISEFIPNDDDIIGIEVQALPLPADLGGTTPH
jgi:hypothetical protein